MTVDSLDELSQKIKYMAEQFTEKNSKPVEEEQKPLGENGERVSVEQFSMEVRNLVERDYTGKLMQIKEDLDFRSQKLDSLLAAQMQAISDSRLILNTIDSRLQELIDNFNFFMVKQGEHRERQRKTLDLLDKVLKDY